MSTMLQSKYSREVTERERKPTHFYYSLSADRNTITIFYRGEPIGQEIILLSTLSDTEMIKQRHGRANGLIDALCTKLERYPKIKARIERIDRKYYYAQPVSNWTDNNELL